MNKPTDKSITDDCVRIKDLGYSSSHHIRMYGQRFDIVSDPFPDGNGIAVQVTTAKEPKKRALRLPKTLLVGFKDLLPKVKSSGNGLRDPVETTSDETTVTGQEMPF
jgi:hypothetical protein